MDSGIDDELRLYEEKSPKPISGIPQVRVLDENSNEVFRGWYVYHETRQVAAFGDYLKDDEVQHIVVTDSFADWNMPKTLQAKVVEFPYRIEVIKE